MADSPRLETTQNAIDRLEAGHDGWRVYVAAEVWFARRTGPLTDQERRTRPQSPLEAAGPDELSALITEAEADDTAQDEPAEAGELDAWTT